jgi:magnesium transporter
MKVRLLRKDRLKPGAAPGTLNPPKDALPSLIHVIAYDVDNLEERNITNPEDLKDILKKWPMAWINVDGLGSVDIIERVGQVLGLHMLALEDVVSTTQRPKAEDYGDFIFCVSRMVMPSATGHTLEQFSLFLGKNFVLTFQENPGDVFGQVRERLRKGGKRIKMVKPDYMTYLLLDAVIDGYFPVLGQYGDRLDDLETRVLENPAHSQMAEIHRTKRELQTLRHCIWPTREALSRLSANTKLVREETAFFLRDCQDHVTQVLDLLETYRERTSGLTDFYVSSINYKLNEVIKVLTIITTIFMPLSFIAGIYGMNFNTAQPHNMPELGWDYGYYIVLGAMGAIAVGMLLYFYKLGWLEKEDKH